MNAIEVRGVTKTYRRYHRFRFRALEMASLGLSRQHRAHHSLRGVDLSVAPGEALGVIGENGCGKSTLLKVMAGVCHPEVGDVTVNGRVASLLELGSGFHPHFTGRDNATLQAALHGLSPAESRTLMPFIEDFAGIGDAFDDLLRTYSSGMVVRLAFAAAVAVEPDILLVDEALAVGDADFQRRCLDRMLHFKKQGRTIVFVTHSLKDVREFCSRTVLLEQGRVALDGEPNAVCDDYLGRVDRKAAAGRGPR